MFSGWDLYDLALKHTRLPGWDLCDLGISHVCLGGISV